MRLNPSTEAKYQAILLVQEHSVVVLGQLLATFFVSISETA